MAYQKNIPQPDDLISDSQSDILDNFTTADDVFAVDHYPFSNNNVNQQGKHDKVTLVQRPSDVNPSLSTEAVLYSKNTGGGDNVVQAVYQIGDLGTDLIYPLPFAAAMLTWPVGNPAAFTINGTFNFNTPVWAPSFFQFTFTKEAPSSNYLLLGRRMLGSSFGSEVSGGAITSTGLNVGPFTSTGGVTGFRMIIYSLPW